MSSEMLWDAIDNMYAPWPQDKLFGEVEGALHALLELHYSVDVLAEHQLQPRLSEFPLVVLPDPYKLTDAFKQAVLDYVSQGGKLLLLGARCASLFEPVLGVTFDGEPQEAVAELAVGDRTVNVNGAWQNVAPAAAEVVGLRYPTRDVRRGGQPAATAVAHGLGQIAAVYGPVAQLYFRTHHHTLRRFIGELAQRLFPDPAVTVEAPPCVDIALRRTRNGKLSLHLMNLAETQRAERFLNTDFVPAVGPIDVTLRVAERPRRLSWVSDGGRVKWSWSEVGGGSLKVSIPKLDVHGVLVIG